MNEKKKRPIKKHGHHSGQTFDVMRPGKAPAAATSRPAIVGHKPLVQDPMMAADSGRRPLMGHRKEIVPALEPAPASDSMPTPSDGAIKESPEQIMAAPSNPAPTTPATPPTAASTASVTGPSPLDMQGSAEDVAPVLTGQPQMTTHPSADVPASSASLAQTTAKFASDPVPLAPVLQPNRHDEPAQPAASTSPTSAPVVTAMPTIAMPEPAAQLLAKPVSVMSSVTGPSAAPSDTKPSAPTLSAKPAESAPTLNEPQASVAAPAMPTKFDKQDKPATPKSPTVAEQIAPKPVQPIKPLPKEAFDALEIDSKSRATPHPNTTVTDAGIVISHHKRGGSQAALWLILLLVLAGGGFAAWYFLV